MSRLWRRTTIYTFGHRTPIIRSRKLLSAFFTISILLTCLIFINQIKPASARTITVGPAPAEYRKIQTAVDNALSNDIIQVAPGTYHEHVRIWDTLTNITIIGNAANPATTIADGMANGTVFRLDGPNMKITGFTVRNAGNGYAAIASERAIANDDYHSITRNIITTSDSGISLGSSSHNTISNNTFFDNPFVGITLNGAHSNNITGNTISESYNGIEITGSDSNTITNNKLSKTSNSIFLSSTSSGNEISRNAISARSACVYSDQVTTSNTFDHNTITETDYGFYFFNSKNGIISYNTIANSSKGIRIYGPSGVNALFQVRNNKITNVDRAIEQISSQGNTFTGNLIQRNTWGLYLSGATGNTYYHNNILSNSKQVYSSATPNTWYINGQKEGNRWSDYTGPDTNPKDGIGDVPYPVGLTTDVDPYPLMSTWSEHDVSIEKITPYTNHASVGSIVNINVTVKNNGKISPAVDETFTVTAKYNSSAIGIIQVINLQQGVSRNVTFNWNTVGVDLGNYTITAEASTVPNELYTDNNNLTDGTITIVEASLLGDINGDGTVNQADLNLLAQAYGAQSEDPRWRSAADLNKDGIVDARDQYLLGKEYGKTA